MIGHDADRRRGAVPDCPGARAEPDRLPRLGDTTVHSGILVALVVIVLVHLMMTRTAFGLKLQVVGANPAAAVHAGLNVAGLTIATFAISAGLIGLGGAVDILGVFGTVRADWNPAYSFLVVQEWQHRQEVTLRGRPRGAFSPSARPQACLSA